MVCKTIVICLALVSTQAISQDSAPMTEEEKPWFMKEDWLKKNAPNGVDITPDMKVWILMNTSINGDVYGMLADDYEARDPNYPKFWMRGYHKNNKKLNYRESRTLFHFDCKNATYYSSYMQTYKADRTVLSVLPNRSATAPIIPGSLAETWSYYACRSR